MLVENKEKEIYDIFNHINAFLVITNGKKLLDVNTSFLKFFDLEKMEDFLAEYSCICDKFLIEDGYLRKKVSEDENWLAHLINNQDKHHKVKMLDIAGKECIFQVSFQSYTQKGEDIYVVAFEDITLLESELQKSKEKDIQMLKQSRLAQMGEMIAMIAHQWRQPLSAISAASSAITLKAKINKLDKELAIELAGKISDYSQHLSTTIDDFREFFKSNKQKKEVTFQDLVTQVLTIIEGALKIHNVTLNQTFTSTKSFHTYENEIKQVILNLIKNAEDILLEKEIENATINVQSYEDEEYVYLSVDDNGGGIPDDIIHKVFDPYFPTKTQKDGTGLGLYMSKMIVEEHCQGSLRVTNTSQGAKFVIALPLEA